MRHFVVVHAIVMEHRQRLAGPTGVARGHLINHDADGSKVIRIITTQSLHHASAITVSEQIKTIGVNKQALFQGLGD